jgi:chromosome segregation ATPase
MKCTVFALFAGALADGEPRPVAKVKKLLMDMRHELEGEQAEDESSKEKMECWCHSNSEQKKQAILIANKQIDALTALIGSKTELSAKLTAEIGGLSDEIAKNTDSLNKATAMRDEEYAQFNDEEKDLLQSIDALKNAIVVLGKHNEASMVSVQSVLRQALAGHSDILADMKAEHHSVIESFLQIGQPAHFQSYAPQSGQIFGILKEMKEQFERNLAKAQKNEMAGKENYAQLKASKEEEIAAANEAVAAKNEDKADSNEARVNGESDLEDTRNALAADTAFLNDLEERCASFEAEYQERSKTRAEEIAAVGEAMSILDSPEAFDLFGKTTTQTSMETQRQGFLQWGAVALREQRARDKAEAALIQLVRKNKDPRLAALASSVQMDKFTKVKEAIDKLIAELVQKGKDEVKKKYWCIDEIGENEKKNALAEQQKGFVTSKIDELKSQIKTLTEDIEAANTQIEENKVTVRRAGEDRNGENNEFQQTVADQRATQTILQKVIDRLRVFYEKKQALLQARGREDPVPGADAPPPPPGFKQYKKKEGGNKVVSMIEDIIAESQRLENEAIQAENDAQAAYEDFVKKTNNEVAALQQEISDKSDTRASAKSELIQAEQDLKETNGELMSLSEYSAEIHGDCDFLLANFEIRQDARADEIQGLREAKDIFNGEQQ